jgi:hypothetical protein
MNTVRLKLSPTIRAEWETRCIGDVIPALANYAGAECVEVTADTARAIAADCAHYVNPRAVDATLGERAAYRALLVQVQRLPVKLCQCTGFHTCAWKTSP